MTSQILVTTADARKAHFDGSVVVLEGTDTERGEHVVFAGDPRPTAGLLDGVAAEGEAWATVEAWQILFRRPAAA